MRSLLKKMIAGGALLACAMGWGGVALAASHYVPGVEGVEAASVPPPGFYYRMYTLWYTADNLRDKNGNGVNNGFDLKVFAISNRFVYITPIKVLGADFGMDVIIPLVNTDISISAARVSGNEFGVGDICVDPIVLSWHLPRWDLSLAAGFFMPTGKSGEPESPGMGFWSLMGSAGATYYLDEKKTWSASVLTRWLKNFENRDTDITPGAELVAEYGIGKSIPIQKDLIARPGLAGYSYLQLSDDDGPGATDDRSRVHAIGPEFNLLWLSAHPFQVNLRYLFEYAAESEPEGQKATLTLTWTF